MLGRLQRRPRLLHRLGRDWPPRGRRGGSAYGARLPRARRQGRRHRPRQQRPRPRRRLDTLGVERERGRLVSLNRARVRDTRSNLAHSAASHQYASCEDVVTGACSVRRSTFLTWMSLQVRRRRSARRLRRRARASGERSRRLLSRSGLRAGVPDHPLCYAMLCYDMLCCGVVWCAVPCDAMLCDAMRCDAMLC